MTPSLLELAGFTYFTGGFFAGPQFSIRRYLEFTEEKLLDNDKGELPNCIGPAMNRFAVGVVYAVLETILTPMFSNAYLLSEEFAVSIIKSFYYNIFIYLSWISFFLFFLSLHQCKSTAYFGSFQSSVKKRTLGKSLARDSNLQHLL